MELQLVNFKQAKDLKELGFPQDESYSYYGVDSDDWDNHYEKRIAAPTLELAAKWLRDEKDIFININHISSGYSSWIKTVSDNANIGANLGYADIYEEVLSNGIDKAIEILKEDNL